MSFESLEIIALQGYFIFKGTYVDEHCYLLKHCGYTHVLCSHDHGKFNHVDRVIETFSFEIFFSFKVYF